MADSTAEKSIPVTSELRIGLAMSGGIALVLYQSGVAHEILQFLRAGEQALRIAPDAI